MTKEERLRRVEYLVNILITELKDFKYFRRCKLEDIPLGETFHYCLPAENLKEDIKGKRFPYRLGKHLETVKKELNNEKPNS